MTCYSLKRSSYWLFRAWLVRLVLALPGVSRVVAFWCFCRQSLRDELNVLQILIRIRFLPIYIIPAWCVFFLSFFRENLGLQLLYPHERYLYRLHCDLCFQVSASRGSLTETLHIRLFAKYINTASLPHPGTHGDASDNSFHTLLSPLRWRGVKVKLDK
jgi:hypothetical protein